MTQKYKLIDIGRSKVCREVDVKSEQQLYKEVGKHLMSSGVDLMTDDDGLTFTVCAGGRPVGKVERVISDPLETALKAVEEIQ
jgi:hypothetical protein